MNCDLGEGWEVNCGVQRGCPVLELGRDELGRDGPGACKAASFSCQTLRVPEVRSHQPPRCEFLEDGGSARAGTRQMFDE